MIKVNFLGTRGSITTPGAATRRYGGHTSCVELIGMGDSGSRRLILDCGTGLVELPEAIAAGALGDIHILLTHHHWDHVQGLPFYAPVHSSESQLHLYGKSIREIEASVDRLFKPMYSPVNGVENVSAQLGFHEVNGVPSKVNGFTVRTAETRHSPAALSFRIELDGDVVVYTPDHEAGDPETDRQLVDLARGADLWILNGFFSPEEKIEGWGHSCHLEAVDLAVEAGVRTLAIFHHNPDHADDVLDHMADAAVERARGTGTGVVMTRDGMVLEIGTS